MSRRGGGDSKNVRDDGPRGEGPPPFGRSWRVLYAAVLLNLALMILLFYLFTRAFS
jgi:hypothetical protein